MPNGAADYVKIIQDIFTGNFLQAATILFYFIAAKMVSAFSGRMADKLLAYLSL